MSGGNCVRNAELSALLKSVEKTYSDRAVQRLANLANPAAYPLVERAAPPTPTNRQPFSYCDAPSPSSQSAPAEDELRADMVPLTLDEAEWLDEVVQRHGHDDMSAVMKPLVDWANAEPSDAKKKLFLQVRCRRCSAGAKGGVKRDHSIELSATQWKWLENVKERCRHASVGKTLRIIIDFYMAICKDDLSFEHKVVGKRKIIEEAEQGDAEKNADPTPTEAVKNEHVKPALALNLIEAGA